MAGQARAIAQQTLQNRLLVGAQLAGQLGEMNELGVRLDRHPGTLAQTVGELAETEFG
jgi:hypothetical protein